MGKNWESNEGNTSISIIKSSGNILVQNPLDILSLPGWTVQDVSDTDEHLFIEASVSEVPLSCPLCSSTRAPYHFGYRIRLIADLPIRMKPVQIRARRRRYRCRECSGTYVDQLPGVHRQHDATERLVEYIQVHALSLTSTFTSLARDVGVSDWLIRDIVMAQIERLEHAYVLQTPRYLGIDEIYVEDGIYCVLTDIERRCVIDLLQKRDCNSVKRWLMRLKKRDQIEAVTQDLWNLYRIAIQALVPNARIIADKYHVLRLANEIVETVRKSLRSTLSSSQAKQLKQDRKILLKREKDLTEQQRFILESWTGFLPIKLLFFAIQHGQTQGHAATISTTGGCTLLRAAHMDFNRQRHSLDLRFQPKFSEGHLNVNFE